MLSPRTVDHMTSNHLGPEIRNNVGVVEPHREGFGFGLGVAVRTQAGLSAVPGNVGEYTWNGAYGTAFFADPKEKLVVVFGTAAPGELRKYYREQVQALDRLFCHITQNWRGRPLTSRSAVIELIAATTTKTGLTVRCELDTNAYAKGIKVSDAEMATLNIKGDAFHPEWNYTISPRSNVNPT